MSENKKLKAKHGEVCRIQNERFGYFGWPTVAVMDDGTLVAVSSGLRMGHVDPWGRTTLQFSYDNGETWTDLRVINDSPIDDRDAGVISLGGKKLLVTWFRSDTRVFRSWLPEVCQKPMEHWTDEMVNRIFGTFVMLSDDAGETWGQPIRVPISSPHGPILLKNGDVLYLGKEMFSTASALDMGEVVAYRSKDGGRTWTRQGCVPPCEGVTVDHFCEPHVVELPDGKLIGMIRLEMSEVVENLPNFSMLQTESTDGGNTWTTAKPLSFHGSPPHLLRHSSGTLILTYGYRQEPFGERVAFSYDEGMTWERDWILRDDGPEGDLGYPSTVELADGTLFTLYYQKATAGEQCSLLYSKWEMPE